MIFLNKLIFNIAFAALTGSTGGNCLPSLKARMAYVTILYKDKIATIDSVRNDAKQSIPCAAYYAENYVLAHNGPGNIFIFSNGIQQKANPLYTSATPKYASNTIGQIAYKDNLFLFTIAHDSKAYKLILLNCLTRRVKVVSRNCDKDFCWDQKTSTVQYSVNGMTEYVNLSVAKL